MRPVNPPKAPSVADDVSIGRTQVPKPPLKLSQKPQTLPDLLREYTLPRVIKCKDSAYHKQQLRSNFDLEQPLLAVQVRRVVKVAARNLNFDGQSNTYSCVGNDLLIPEDYPGWFAVLGAPNSLKMGHDEAIPYFSRLLELDQRGCTQFLVGGEGHVRGLVQTESVAGNVTNLKFTILPGTVLRSAGLYTTGEQPTQKREKNKKNKNKVAETQPQMFLKCLDEHERVLWIPTDQKGKFYVIAWGELHRGFSYCQPIIKMADIRKKFQLPLVVRLVHGKTPSIPCTFTKSLLLANSGVSETLIASTLVNHTNIHIELPLGSDIKFYAAEHTKELVSSQAYVKAARFCHEKLPGYIREMKVVYGNPQLVELRRRREQAEQNKVTPLNPSTPKPPESPTAKSPDKASGKSPALPKRDPWAIQSNHSPLRQGRAAEESVHKTVDSKIQAQEKMQTSEIKEHNAEETEPNSNSKKISDENKGRNPAQKDQVTEEKLHIPESNDDEVVLRHSKGDLHNQPQAIQDILRTSIIIHSEGSPTEEYRPASTILVSSIPGTPTTPSKNAARLQPRSPAPCNGPTGSPKPFKSNTNKTSPRRQNSNEETVPSDAPPPIPDRSPISPNADKDRNKPFSLMVDEDASSEDNIYTNVDFTVLKRVVFSSSKQVQETSSPPSGQVFPVDRPNLEMRTNNPADHYDKADEDNKSTTYHKYSTINDSRPIPGPSFALREEPDSPSSKESNFKHANMNTVGPTSNTGPRVISTFKPDIHSLLSQHRIDHEHKLQSPSIPRSTSQEKVEQNLLTQLPLPLPNQTPTHQTQVTQKPPLTQVTHKPPSSPRTTHQAEVTQKPQPPPNLQNVPQGHAEYKPSSSPGSTSSGRDRPAVKPPQSLNLQTTNQGQAAPKPPPFQQTSPSLNTTQRQPLPKPTSSPVLASSSRGNITQSPSFSPHPQIRSEDPPPVKPRSPQTFNQEKLARKPPLPPVQTVTTGPNSKSLLSLQAPPLPPPLAAPSSPKPSQKLPPPPPPPPHKR